MCIMQASSIMSNSARFVLHLFLQERLKQENLRKELDLKSSEREKQMQQTLSTALEMQKKSVEEAAALNDELARTKETSKEQMHEGVDELVIYPLSYAKPPDVFSRHMDVVDFKKEIGGVPWTECSAHSSRQSAT